VVRAVALAALLSGLSAHAGMNVAVLYFDNNTALREYDVLQKGMADMLITDLGPSEQLTMVEREKLDVVLGEIKQSHTKYFDPETALKIGKLANAAYAVTGAFTAFDPEVRIDVRMIDVKTSKVVVSAQVQGKKDAFFELEQQLVKKFLDSLSAKAPAAGGAVTLASAVKYSQGLQTLDDGDLKAASTQLAAVVRDSPDFPLARTRYSQLLKRLREAGKKHEEAIGSEEAALVEGIGAAVSKYGGQVLKGNDLEVYFCYRAMRTAYLMWKLEQGLGPPQGPLKVKVADRAVASKWLAAIWENEVALVDDAVKNSKPLEYMNHAASCPMALERQKLKDFYRLKTIGIPWDYMPRLHPADRIPMLVELASNGRFRRAHFKDDEDQYPTLEVLPTLVVLDPSKVKEALALIELADKELEKPASRNINDAKLMLEAARATLLLNAGRREEGIATLQAWLEKNPKARAYKAVEGQVEALLGVSDEAKKNGEQLRACTASDPAMRTEIDRLFDAEGSAAVVKAVGAAGAKCASKAYGIAAWNAALRGECAVAKACAAKGEDVAGIATVCP
jgi:TolB-like protein